MLTGKSDNQLSDKEAEYAMLGAFICSHVDRAVALESVRLEMIQDERVKVAWKLLSAMYLGGKEIGLYELVEHSRRAGERETCDPDWLLKIVNSCPNELNVAIYAERVRDLWMRRGMIRQIDVVRASLAAPDSGKIDLAKAWGQLSAIMADQSTNSLPIQIGTILEDAMDSRSAGERPADVGIASVDKEINLYEPGEVTVLAARPGGGKSSLMRQMIWNASARGPVLVFTLEVTPRVLTQQLTCEAAKVPFETWRNSVPNEEDNLKILEAMGEVGQRPIHIFPRASVSALDVVLAITQMVARGISPIFVAIDYLGLMKHEKSERQDLAIGATTRSLKLMALEKKIPLLLLCQMNRQSEQRGSQKEYDRPRLADLRDSGSIEQDADNILFLWRKDRDEYTKAVVGRTLTVAKRRNGSVFEADLLFDMPAGRFNSPSYPSPVDEMVTK